MHAFVVFALSLAPIAALSAPAAPPALQSEAEREPAITVAAIDAALQRGARWLCERQQDGGSFAPATERGACPVALTAMATWGLNEPEPRCIEPAAAERAARFLLAQRREDGGIYDPARGLAVYTSGIATRALRTMGKREDWPELAAAVADVELFTYRRATPESVIDDVALDEVAVGRSAEVARGLLEGNGGSDAARRKALEFLARSKRDPVTLPSRLRTAQFTPRDTEIGPFSYDDLLPIVYFDLSPEQQLALRVRAALGAYYTPDRNPDLTKRYGAAGFTPGTQGLFYYYFIAAKALTTFGERSLVTADGVSHDWADELASRLVRMQRGDGAWANTDPAWWEGEPVLATSYALLTLKLCRASLLAR